jgi:hypothetical protein
MSYKRSRRRAKQSRAGNGGDLCITLKVSRRCSDELMSALLNAKEQGIDRMSFGFDPEFASDLEIATKIGRRLGEKIGKIAKQRREDLCKKIKRILLCKG